MPRTGTTLCHPKAMLLFCSRHLAINSPLGHFNGDNARLLPNLPDTQKLVTPKFNSSNSNMAFAKLQRTQSLAHPTTHAAISTFSSLSYLHFVSLPSLCTHNLSTSPAAQKANPIFHAANKNQFLNTFRLSPSSSYFPLLPNYNKQGD